MFDPNDMELRDLRRREVAAKEIQAQALVGLANQVGWFVSILEWGKRTIIQLAKEEGKEIQP